MWTFGFLSSLTFAEVDFPLRSQILCWASGPAKLPPSPSLPKLQKLRTEGLSACRFPTLVLAAIVLLEVGDVLWVAIWDLSFVPIKNPLLAQRVYKKNNQFNSPAVIVGSLFGFFYWWVALAL